MSTNYFIIKSFINTTVTKFDNKINVTRFILSILNVSEYSENCEMLGTEDK